MTEYALYVESGPRRRKTQVHVLELLGCIAQGPTTEAALEATPEAVRMYLRFLRRHGEAVEPEAAFTTTVAAHVMEGGWLGQGDPAPGFAPDFQPLAVEDQAVYLKRLAWLQADLLQLVRDLPPKQLVAEPMTGRSIYRILEHVAGAHYAYMQSPVGRPEGLAAALRAVEQGPENVADALTRLWRTAAARLDAMTDAERTQMVAHGQVTWTARRALRRMLEHHWEHLQEITGRLGGTQA
jgi:predicted RNase H-like HicB family nuclease